MKNASRKIIYVGKAKNLKNRIKSYFANSKTKDRYQIDFLINELKDIEYIVTKNERDAFLLENSLIKKHKPKYNIQFKDDKTYYLLKLDTTKKYPRLYFTRKQYDDGAVYLGPFSSAESLKKTKKLLHRLFPLRDCTDSKFNRHRNRPCINYNIGLCSAPCANRISLDDYQSLVKRFDMYTSGKFGEILKLLRSKMRQASKELRYEQAATLRDQLEFLKMHLDEKGLVHTSVKDRDIIGIYNESGATSIIILFYRNGSVIDKSEYYFDKVVGDKVHLLEKFIINYYSNTKNIPREINLPVELSDKDLITEWINSKISHKVEILVPKKGKKLEYVKLAQTNAIDCYERHSARSKSILIMLNNLKKKLKLRKIPKIIECYDISNIQGYEAVASLVRFENGFKVKDRYKRYRIKTVKGANDFAMIKEVIFRRLKRQNQRGWDIPDLLLIDGGPGQLTFAKSAMDKINIPIDIDIIAIAKGGSRDRVDRIYVQPNETPILLDSNSNELLYLMRIRDEAHRFALDYHKKLRKKKAMLSAYESIPGVGPKIKTILQKNFGNINNIRDIDVNELAEVKGLHKKLALSIKEYIKTMNL